MLLLDKSFFKIKMMKFPAVIVLLSALAAAATADITFTMDQGAITLARGDSFTYTGTIVRTGFSEIPFASVEFPRKGADLLSTISLVQAFKDYVNNVNFTNYTGPLFTVTVPLNQPLGLYSESNNGQGEFPGLSELYLTDESGNWYGQKYSVNVTAVPEPASMAALGLGAVALLRRRKRA
jgi:hypothetical protein